MGERETGTSAPWSVEAIEIIIWLASNFQTMGVCVAKYSIVRDIRSSYANWALSLLVQFLGEVEKKNINAILLKYHEKFKVGISSESIHQTEDKLEKDNNYQWYYDLWQLLYIRVAFSGWYMYLLKYSTEIFAVLPMIQNT